MRLSILCQFNRIANLKRAVRRVASVPGNFILSHPATPQPQPLDWARIRVVFAAVAVTLFLASLGQTVPTTALTTIVGELGGLDQITWVITAYLLAATVGAPVFGKLGDLFGRKGVLQVGILVFLCGSVLCALAPSIWVLVAGRAVQGFGGGGLIVVSMAAIADVLPARQRGRFQGILGSVFGLSTVVGPLAGGFIVQHFAWEWIFLLNLPLGLAVLGILTVALEKSPRRERAKLDYTGAAMLALLLSLAVIIANLGGVVLPWGSPLTILMLCGMAVALAGFILAERRASEPLLPLKLFTLNNFVVSNLVGLITGVAMFSTITFVPFFMQVVKGVSPAASGVYVFPMMLGLVTTSAIAGRIMSITGRYRILPVWSTLLLAVGMILMATAGPDTPNPLIAIYMLMAGIGIGPVMSVGITAIQNSVPFSMVGVGTASANMFRLIGGSLGTAAYGAVFAAGLTRTLGTVLPDTNPRALSAQQIAAMEPETQALVIEGIAQALHPVFWASAVLACLASAVALLMVEHPLEDQLPAARPAE